ncbi:PAS domain-containing protein [Methylobacterium sp. E-065]|uniref:PAS domain-containing protein n=1 Tax=Methylobacterium sp. E-065 TaxID=2836583 RepID=UPI001FB94C4E|nr:PAS domain-containing protein [Methylobacterium sp. E-065]MCJ2021872.1 PAS domain-containing protein [Methylobacterium sp. E-065]
MITLPGADLVQALDYRSLFEAVPAPLLVVSPPHWIIVAANDARLRATGTTQADQVGRRLFDLFPDDPADPAADGVRNLTASFQRVLDTKSSDTMAVQRYAVRDAQGRFEERWWSPVNVPVLGPDGEVALILHRVEEVTETVRLRGEAEAMDRLAHDQQRVINRLIATEAELRRSEEFSSRVLASSADCIKVLDLDARLEFMTEQGMCVMEVDDFETIRGACWPDFWMGDGHAKAVDAVATARGGGIARFEGFATTLKGSPRWWDVIVTPVNGPDGRPEKLLSVSRDVTAAKRAEEALRTGEERLRDLNATLEARVAERTAELEMAQDALRQSQKLEAVGQLTGGVAHDFNNLLTVIKSSTDLLKRPNLPEERRARYVGAISDTVDRAAKLTAQLLAFARRQSLKPEVFDAGASVRAISGMMSTLAGSRIEVEIRLPDEPLYLNVDPSQFDTALVNIAVNARDAMDGEGRIVVVVAAVETMPAVRSHGAIPGDYVAVSVTDTGIGIAPEMLDRIFEPFFTTKGVGQGTGLGLSQVFGFAKQSGGEVTVESRVGAGATFTLFLPRAAEAGRPIVEIASEALLDGQGTCVLVVEDNAEIGSFATQSLVELGYLPVLASDAEAALAELAKDASRFDVVFTDVMMPGMDGVDLARRIRRDYPDLPVLLTSGYSHVLAQNGTHGFDLLRKPYSVEELSRLLRRTVEAKRRR